MGINRAIVSGAFNAGTWQGVVRVGERQVAVVLRIDSSGHLAGTITDRSSTITIQPDSRLASSANPGIYNVTFSPSEPVTFGHAWARVVVNRFASARLAGRLPNGISFAKSAKLRSDGSMPVYHGHGGTTGEANLFTGALTFGANQGETCNGEFHWRYADESALISQETFLSAQGSAYVRPTRSVFAPLRVRVAIETVTTFVDLTSPTNIIISLPNSNRFTLRIDPATGRFRGSYFSDTDLRRFDGLLNSDYSRGRGVSWGFVQPPSESASPVVDRSSPHPVWIDAFSQQ
jgi:hypothetical protein